MVDSHPVLAQPRPAAAMPKPCKPRLTKAAVRAVGYRSVGCMGTGCISPGANLLRPFLQRERRLLCRFYGASGEDIISIGADVHRMTEPLHATAA
jgi:hypothetical protein